MRKIYLMLSSAICIFVACSKNVSNEQSNAAQQRATQFQTAIETHKFRPVAFYSDKPINYTNAPNGKMETDLWKYVKDYIKDDLDYFSGNGKLLIYQGTNKQPGNNADVIYGSYGISVKGSDVMVNFVDYNYSPLQYRVDQFDNAYITLFIDGPSGSKLYSKFARTE